MERRSPIAFVRATLLPALLCILLSTPSWAAPTTIRSIQFSGNTAFSSRELAEGILTKEGGPYSSRTLDADIRSVVDRFRTAGFLDVRIAIDGPLFSTDSTDVEIRLAIYEGPLSHLERITFAGLTHFAPEDVVARFSSRIGSPLDVLLFEQDLDGLLERYERIGYPLAECRVENILRVPGPEADSLFVTVRVNEGERITIDEIRVQGNKTTDPAVVVRETRMQLGELFNTARVNAIRQRLQRLNIFSDVSEPELYTRNDKGGLLIVVQEGNTNTFDGVLGYIPAAAGEGSGYVTGLASIAMRNLFGTGRKLNFNWQRVDRHSQELGVQYVEPWVLGAPVNVGFGFLQRQQDTSYVQRTLSLKTELMLSEEWSASLLLGSETIVPSADSTARRVFRSSMTTIGAELQYDTRDDPYSPRSGARYKTDYSYGRKKITDIPERFRSTIPARVTVQRLTLDLDFYITTFERQVFALGFHERELQSGQMEEGELFRLGGARTLRGYRENQFLGSRIAWSNTEYRFLLARRSFLYGFFDTGYYLRPADDVRDIARSDGFKFGYGIGIQLETALGNLGVSFALGQGDSFGEGKIHFGLINDF